jgi:hypothetical protein
MAYNGWKNYETWNVALWVSNEQGSERESRTMAQDAWDNAEACRTFTRKERAVLDLADSLKEWIEEQNPLASDASVWSDLLSAALSEVDWHEWAENLIEDVDADEDEPEDEDDDAEEINVAGADSREAE